MLMRYLVLSPSEEIRHAFLGTLFDSFSLSSKAKGEQVRLSLDGGGMLEVVGVGEAGNLYDTARTLLSRSVQIDGILMLLPSGDESSWKEAQTLAAWTDRKGLKVPIKTLVLDDRTSLDKEAARRALLALMDDQERILSAP